MVNSETFPRRLPIRPALSTGSGMLEASDAICFSTFWSAAFPKGGASANSSLSFWILCSTVVSWSLTGVCVAIALFSSLVRLTIDCLVTEQRPIRGTTMNRRSNQCEAGRMLHLQIRGCMLSCTWGSLLGCGEETVDDGDAVRQKQAEHSASDARGGADERVSFRGLLAD